MKRIIATILALIMCLALVACGNSEKEELYDKYESIIRSLEKHNYDKALEKIEKLSSKHQSATTEKENDKVNFKSLIVGEWIISCFANDESMGNITFNENGECNIGGETYSWKLEKYYDTWAEYVISRDGDDIYRVTLNDRTESDESLLVSLWRLGDSEEKHIGDFFPLSEYTVLELTTDNFLDYFEISERVSVNRNAFNEPTEISVNYYYVLKAEYGRVEADISEVAIEYSYIDLRYEIADADLEKGTFEIGARVEEDFDTEEYTNMTTLHNIYNSSDDYIYGFNAGSCWITAQTEYVNLMDITEILRVSGNIYVLKEAK